MREGISYNIHCCCCISAARSIFLKSQLVYFFSEKRSWFYKTFMAGGINRDDPDNAMDNKEHMVMAFFRDHVARILNMGWIKMLVILIFAAYLGGACFGLTKIKEGLERRKLSKEDSYSVKFFDLEDEYYREFPYRIQVRIT